MCQICDENKDFNDCDFVENLYEKEISMIAILLKIYMRKVALV